MIWKERELNNEASKTKMNCVFMFFLPRWQLAITDIAEREDTIVI